MHRDELLQISDEELLARCSVSSYQGSGPGGQHRNRTLTGVRLVLANFNLEIRACEDRSHLRNQEIALARLRLRLATQQRETPPPQVPFSFPGSKGRISVENRLYAPFIADTLDRMDADGGRHQGAAAAWGLSSSALARLVYAHKDVLEAVQSLRARHGLPALQRPG